MDRQRRIIETFGFRKRLDYFRNLLSDEHQRLGRPLRILDVGCGTGLELTDPLTEDRHLVVGLDVHLPSLRLGQRARYVCGDTLSLVSSSFDVVICSEVLEHVRRPLEMLRELNRILVPGGLCLVTVPNGYGPYETVERLSKLAHVVLQGVKLEPKVSYVHTTARVGNDSLNYASKHLTFFTPSSIRRLFFAAGFLQLHYRGRTLLCGTLLSETLSLSEGLVRANEWLGDVAPSALVSGWMFALRSRTRVVLT